MTVLVVSNQKGGVGKTTTAISLGAAMVEQGQRVLIVDLDPQANATSGLGISKERANGIYGVLLRERPLAEAVVATDVPGLDLIPVRPGHGRRRGRARAGDGPGVPPSRGAARRDPTTTRSSSIARRRLGS